MTNGEEPDYLRQTAEFGDLSQLERDAWWLECLEEAKARGCTFMRRSIDDVDNPTMALVEAWRVQPNDQGAIRWQMTHAGH